MSCRTAMLKLNMASGDFLGGDLDGFIISGSAEIGETFFVLGSYNDGEIESALDLEVLRLGFGLHGSISESLDWVGSLSTWILTFPA